MFIVLGLIIHSKNKKLNKLSTRYNNLEYQYNLANIKIQVMESNIKFNQNMSKLNGCNPNDLTDMAYFAMIQAHPDNPNGNNERFIKYKRIYDTLKN